MKNDKRKKAARIICWILVVLLVLGVLALAFVRF